VLTQRRQLEFSKGVVKQTPNMSDITPSLQNNLTPPLDEKARHNTELIENLAELGANGEVLNAKWDVLKEEANKAEEFEHSFSLWEAVKEYKAVSLQFRF
jgi:predicted nuclease with TOPRIM domain